jgi:pimeloyl-ACP methyl ester carboxylesterase
MRRRALVVSFVTILVLLGVADEASSQATRIDTRPGITVHLLIALPKSEPKGGFVIFPGGPGLVWLRNGQLRQDFPVVPELFAEQGFVAVVVHAPSDHPKGFAAGREFRGQKEHVEDGRKIVEYVAKRWNIPIFLLGHSSGDASVTNMALSLKDERIKGIVMAAPGVGAIPRFNIPIEEITVPVLGIKHKEDNCSSFELAFKQHARFVKSPRANFIEVLGGDRSIESGCGGGQLNPGGRSYTHGFSGKEREVVKIIAEWALGNAVPARIGP